MVAKKICCRSSQFEELDVFGRVLLQTTDITPLEICRITKNAAQKLADERGWSPQLVQNIMQAAERAIQTKR